MNKKLGIALVTIAILLLGVVFEIFVTGSKTDITNSDNTLLNSQMSGEVVETIGETEITICVFDKENVSIYEDAVETDCEYLSEVLVTLDNLDVVTEDGPYGEYITSIKGIEQGDDYYWSYYIDGEYAPTGISSCKVEAGSKYEFKIEKFEY